jgi:anti-sigma B factor antagonist
MDVQLHEEDAVTIVSVRGDVDASTAPALREAVLKAAASDGRLLLDLSEVSFMSSAGLRVLLVLHRTIDGNRGRVVLVGLAATVRETMAATGFLKFFSTAATLDEGKARL